MKKRELQKKAWRLAAVLLETDMDSVDMDSDMSEEDGEYVREFIRTKVVACLEKRGSQ